MTAAEDKELVLARSRGFCGVVRTALAALEKLLAEHPDIPVCVLYDLVHNRRVKESFVRRGVRFIDDLAELPPGAGLLLGAHGVPAATERRARELAAVVVDTTCPVIRARQREAAALGAGDTLILLGYPDHQETVGIIGWSGAGTNLTVASAEAAERIAVPSASPVLLTQTTFDANELARCREVLERRFPGASFRGGLCGASQARQAEAERIAQEVDAVVVAGSPHSSNTRRLRETAERCGKTAVLVECAAELPPELFDLRRVGLTAGASTPDADVDEIRAAFAAAGFRVGEAPAAK